MRWGPGLAAAGMLWLGAGPDASAQAEAFPPGQVVEHVACRTQPDLTYALYLPTAYDRDRKWPLLIVMDPRGRAPMALELFRDGAERLGFLVMSSYDTSSDTPRDRNIEAVKAMLPDAEARFALDTDRIVLAGFSGTARTAWVLAAALRPHVVGIIGMGGGLPRDFDPTGTPVAFFGGAGTTDFNYEEMRALDDLLDRADIRHRFVVWEGPHSWAPADVAGDSLAWMRLNAIRRGLAVAEPGWVEGSFDAGLAEARALESEARLPEAFRLYRALAEDFDGLHDVTAVASRARDLEKSKEVRRQRSRDGRFASEYHRYEQRFWEFIATLRGGAPAPAGVPGFLRIEALQARAAQDDDPPDADAAQRILAMVAVQTSFYLPTEFLAAGRPDRALAALRIAAAIRPGGPWVCLQQARAHAQLGGKQDALQSLGCAVDSGLLPREMLEDDAYLAPLRDDAAFRALLEGLP